MDSVLIGFVSACTALVASVVGPIVTIAVARRQINASVVSTNRHRWIAELRDHIAELVALMTAVAVVRTRWTGGPWQRGMSALEADPRLLEKLERIVLVQWKIRLLLNPVEPGSVALLEAITASFARLEGETWDEAAMRANIDVVTRLTRDILKQEWQRVKAGT